MTIEEAVEVILGGKAWEACPQCHGTGFINMPDAMESCEYCARIGHIANADYLAASFVLQRPMPPYPPATAKITFAAFEDIVMPASFHFKAINKLKLDL